MNCPHNTKRADEEIAPMSPRNRDRDIDPSLEEQLSGETDQRKTSPEDDRIIARAIRISLIDRGRSGVNSG